MDKEEIDRRLSILLLRVGLDPAKPPRYPWLHQVDEKEVEKRIKLLKDRFR